MTMQRQRRRFQKDILDVFKLAREWIGTDVARQRVVWRYHKNQPLLVDTAQSYLL